MQQYSLNPSSLPVTELAQTEVNEKDGYGGTAGASHLNTATVATQEANRQVEGEDGGDGGTGREVCNGTDGNAL